MMNEHTQPPSLQFSARLAAATLLTFSLLCPTGPLLSLPADAAQEQELPAHDQQSGDRPAYDRLAHSTKPQSERDALITGSIEQVLAMANGALLENEPQAAEGLYRGALMECWLALGSVELADNRLAAARTALGEAMNAMARPHRVTRTSLALLQLWVDEVDAAVENLRNLSEERASDPNYRLHYIHALVVAGQVDVARQQLEIIRQGDPELADQIETLLVETEGDREARIKAFRPRLNVGILAQKAPAELDIWRQKIYATQAQIYRNLAVLHRRSGRPQRAADSTRLADEFKVPQGTESLPMIDLAHATAAPAVAPLSIAAGMLWETATVHLAKVVQEAEAGELDAAEATLRKLLQGTSDAENAADPAAVHDMLGIILTEKKKYDEAVEHFEAALATEPAFALQVHQHLARLYFLRGQDTEVAVQLRAAAGLGQLDRDLTMHLAQIELADASRRAAAETQLRSAVQRFRSTRALVELAALEVRAEKPQAAFAHLQRARAFAPNSEEVLVELARVQLMIGKRDAAIETLEALQRMHPMVSAYAASLAEARKEEGGEESPSAQGLKSN